MSVIPRSLVQSKFQFLRLVGVRHSPLCNVKASRGADTGCDYCKKIGTTEIPCAPGPIEGLEDNLSRHCNWNQGITRSIY